MDPATPAPWHNYTLRTHIHPNPNIVHFSLFNTNCIITSINTHKFCIEKKVARIWGNSFIKYRAFDHKKGTELSEQNAAYLFHGLKLFFDLAEEPTFDEPYAEFVLENSIK